MTAPAASALLEDLSLLYGWALTNTERLTLTAALRGHTRTQVTAIASRRKTADGGRLTPAVLAEALNRRQPTEPTEPEIAPHAGNPRIPASRLQAARTGIAQARAALAAHTTERPQPDRIRS